jgi:hypothetical protein
MLLIEEAWEGIRAGEVMKDMAGEDEYIESRRKILDLSLEKL